MNVILYPTLAPPVVPVPKQVSGLTLWLDATSLSLSNGTAVSTWADSSGVGNDATQSTSGNRPTFHTNQQNSLPMVTFDGSSSYMTAPAASISSGSGVCMFLVFKNFAAATNTAFLNRGDLSDATKFFEMAIQSNIPCTFVPLSGGSYGAYQAPAYGPFGDGGTHLFIASLDSSVTDTVTYYDEAGTSIYSSSSFSGTINYQNIALNICRRANNSNYANTKIGEILIYNRPLTYSTETTNVRAYLKTKWGM